MLYVNPFSLHVALHLLKNQQLSVIHMVVIKVVLQIVPPLCLLAHLGLRCLGAADWV